MLKKLLLLFLWSALSIAGGMGKAKTILIIRYLPTEQVRGLLPAELSPSSRYENDGLYPVLIYLNKQRNASGEIFGIPTFPYMGSFSEVALTVPFVKYSENATEVFKYHSIILLDGMRAVMAGKFYGLNKVYKKITVNRDSFSLDNDGNPLDIITFKRGKKYTKNKVLQEVFNLKSIAVAKGKYICNRNTRRDRIVDLVNVDYEIVDENLFSELFFEDNNLDLFTKRDLKSEGAYYYKNTWIMRKVKCEL